MEDPLHCSVCNRPLRRLKHQIAHEQVFHADAEMRTCPENLLSPKRYQEPRHDEWHRCEDDWIRREP